ncbi:MAG: AraC family transcriptional regulator [Planctomycetota bacterium]
MTDLGTAARPFDLPDTCADGLHIDLTSGLTHIHYHFHNAYELTALTGSHGTRSVAAHAEIYAQSDLVLLAPGMPHGWSIDACEPDAVHTATALFTHEGLGNAILTHRDAAPVLELLHDAERGVVFNRATAVTAMRRMQAIGTQHGMRRRLQFLLLLCDLALETEHHALLDQPHRQRGSDADHRALCHILALVQAEPGRQLALEEAASHLDMSVPTFTRFFRRMTGDSFIAYMNRWRIQRACGLLRETGDKVLAISQTVGFGNLSHFNRQFHREVGCTPTQYRRHAATEETDAGPEIA